MSETFLSAELLDITEAERDGLIQLRKAFLSETGPVHIPSDETWGDVKGVETIRVAFSMQFPTAALSPGAREAYGCGCVACIGGHLSLLMQGVDVLTPGPIEISGLQTAVADCYVTEAEFGPLGPLFYPHDLEVAWDRISARSAGYAITNFLTTGKPHWERALEAAGQSDLLEA